MPVNQNFTLALAENGNATLGLQPPTNIGGWSLHFQMCKRQGGEAIINKYLASGFSGVSGMTIINSGQGVMRIDFNPLEVSGQIPGNYYYCVDRTTSGFYTRVIEGLRLAGG